jgi:predicted transcriptional regulator
LDNDNPITGLTADIVAAYVAANRVAAGDLPGLIQSVHGALSGAGAPAAPEPVPGPEKVTAAQARKSITDAGLISFEDGRSYKSMKRHLSGRGLTPAQYREKWGLPSDYPMVAPAYAAQRSEMAKRIGLGQKRSPAGAAPEPTPAPAVDAPPKAEAAPPAPKRGRPKKAS